MGFWSTMACREEFSEMCLRNELLIFIPISIFLLSVPVNADFFPENPCTSQKIDFYVYGERAKIEIYLEPDILVEVLDFHSEGSDMMIKQWKPPFKGNYVVKFLGNFSEERRFEVKECELHPPIFFSLPEEFSRFPIFIEVRKGESIVSSITLKNPDPQPLEIELGTSLPEWISLSPEKLSIPAGENRSSNLFVSIPEDAKEGIYRVELEPLFFILEVKPYTIDENFPTLLRWIEAENNHAKVSIWVRNGQNFVEKMEILEELRSEPDEIEFDVEPELKGKIARWEMKDLERDESRVISYRVPSIFGELSPYLSWKIHQANVHYGKGIRAVKILGISSTDLVRGKEGKIVLSLFSSARVDLSARLDFQERGDWLVSPGEVNISFTGEKSINFSVIPLKAGAARVTARLKNSEEISRDATVWVREDYSLLIYSSVAISILAISIYLRRHHQKSKRREIVSTLREVKRRMK